MTSERYAQYVIAAWSILLHQFTHGYSSIVIFARIISFSGDGIEVPERIWKCVLDAACEVAKEVFTAQDIVEKIHGTTPEIPVASIRSYVIAMAPNHPSSHIYASAHKDHPCFEYPQSGYSLKEPIV